MHLDRVCVGGFKQQTFTSTLDGREARTRNANAEHDLHTSYRDVHTRRFVWKRKRNFQFGFVTEMNVSFIIFAVLAHRLVGCNGDSTVVARIGLLEEDKKSFPIQLFWAAVCSRARTVRFMSVFYF